MIGKLKIMELREEAQQKLGDKFTYAGFHDEVLKDGPVPLSVLEETEGKAIIWAHYQHDVQKIVAAIEKIHGPGSVVHYYGLTPKDQRQENIKKFQGENGTRFLVGTPATGGYGITLTQANTVIYYSNGYDLEKRLQSEDRAHRIGQHKPVTYVDILAEETVDAKIVKSLRKKVNIASKVMGEELKTWI